MEEVLSRISDFVIQHKDLILLWVTTPVVGGLSIWGIVKIVLALIGKKATFTKTYESLKETSVSLIDTIKANVDEIKTLKDELPNILVASLQKDKEARTQAQRELYEKIMQNGEALVDTGIKGVEATAETRDNIIELTGDIVEDVEGIVSQEKQKISMGD